MMPGAEPAQAGNLSEAAAARARAVMRMADRAALATLRAAVPDGNGAGWPFPSLVLVAFDHDATPVLLLSDLADHTRNLAADPRVGLLFDATAGMEEPLAGTRVSVLGRAVAGDRRHLRERFLRRHPAAAAYAGFGDFRIWQVGIESVHLVAGFGRIHHLPGNVIIPAWDVAALAAQEADIVRHMNEDHADAVDLYASVLLGRPGGGWVLTGVDPEGCDLRRGPDVARLAFDRPVPDAAGVRRKLVELAMRARRGAGAGRG
jgi:putative heme iron utilization protein